LSGFFAAKGCFNLQEKPCPGTDLGWDVYFRICLDQKDEKDALNSIQKDIGVGRVTTRKADPTQYQYTILHVDYCLLILDYLKKFPLRVIKNVDLVRMRKMINLKKSRDKIPWKGKVLKRVKNLLKRLDK
jgi:hypothetical protein